MKKRIALAASILVTVSVLSSCKGDRICECKDANGKVQFVSSFRDSKDAKADCEGMDAMYQSEGYECELR